MSQLAEDLRDKVPSALPTKALGFEYRSLVALAQQVTWKQWVDAAGKVDWKRLRWLSKDETPQERAYSKVALMENLREDKGEPALLTRAEKEKLYPEYKNLTAEAKDKVDLSLTQSWEMTRILAKRRWDAHRDRIEWNMAKIIMSYDKTMYHDKAKALAKEGVHLIFDMPKTMEEFQAFFNEREKFFGSLPIPDKGKQDLEAAIRENLEPYNKLGDQLLGKPEPDTGIRPGKRSYLPEVRVRDWHVAWRIHGEDLPHHEAF